MRSNHKEYERALRKRERMLEAFGRMRSAWERGEADLTAEHLLENAVQQGLYEHWKSENGRKNAPPEGCKFYLVRGVHLDANRKKSPEVAYQALYMPHSGRKVLRDLLDEKEGFLMPIDRPALQAY